MSLLKQHRGAATASRLTAEVDKLKKGNYTPSSDELSFWKLKQDKAKNGSALIRFLPEVKGESVPWVKYFHHAFEGNNGWYIEKSLTTIEQPDPVAEYNRELWNTGVDANKDIARKQKRKLQYVANILVIKDPLAPENEGKVFRYKFGPKIFEKVTGAFNDVNDGIENRKGFDPFCPFEGADFILRLKTVDNIPNYDDSKFAAPAPLFGGDTEKIDKLWFSQYPLQAIIAPEAFKSYEELKKRLDRVIGVKPTAAPSVTAKPAPARAQVRAENVSIEDTAEPTSGGDFEDPTEDLEYLTSLAEEN